MCSSGHACCPPAQIFQEEICGVFDGSELNPVWLAPAGDYIQGTFRIFNSSASGGNAEATVVRSVGADVDLTDATPGNTTARTVNNPIQFRITAANDVSGEYCITLYKRVRA